MWFLKLNHYGGGIKPSHYPASDHTYSDSINRWATPTFTPTHINNPTHWATPTFTPTHISNPTHWATPTFTPTHVDNPTHWATPTFTPTHINTPHPLTSVYSYWLVCSTTAMHTDYPCGRGPPHPQVAAKHHCWQDRDTLSKELIVRRQGWTCGAGLCR